MNPELRYASGLLLPRGHGSLVNGVQRALSGSVHALALGGGYSVGPSEGRVVYFGRNRPEVHICIGEDDRQVSRRHGELKHWEGRWWLRNTGRRPIRLPRAQWLFADEEAVPLAEGYTPLLVPGSREREHLLEVFVTGTDGAKPVSRHTENTDPAHKYELIGDEKLVLAVLGQRYLLHDPSARPLTWEQVAAQLADLDKVTGWTAKKVAYKVNTVRGRLSSAGVPGLTREEVGEPVGNALNDNLLRELLRSTTLVPKDLEMLE
nr:FHA domain-containing protein [Kibdelosporangium sp. MJ126-NF4]CEL20986.1 hypothetical protein [Kibdelosporangium sp. MJ126-NF4]CTQ95500.1 hypothetical protein [Kibdelosporangium sp. MJ126-NF4]